MRASVAGDPYRAEIGFIPHRPGHPEAINADSFEDDVLQSAVPVLVEFWAARCAPCRRLAPALVEAAAQMADDARVFTINVDEELPAAERCGIHAVPTTLVFVGGVERARIVGATDAASLVHLLKSLSREATNPRPAYESN